MKKFLLPVVAFAFLAIPARPSMAQQEQLLEAKGKLTLLRVHDVGSSYGPPTDRIDVEVVICLDSKPDYAFGFQLRNDEQGRAHQGMLDLLRDAFNHNWTVNIDYYLGLDHHGMDRKNARMVRVWLTK